MTKDQKIIKGKVGLLELARQLGNVSQACKMLGYSRDSFYRFKDLYDKGGELALQEISRKKPILANRTAPEIAERIVEFSLEQPAFGQIRVANEMTWTRPATSCSPSRASRKANGNRSARRMGSSDCMKSGSRPRPCCPRRKQRPCCFGLCWLLARPR
jgi:Winged helix-turn helix